MLWCDIDPLKGFLFVPKIFDIFSSLIFHVLLVISGPPQFPIPVPHVLYNHSGNFYSDEFVAYLQTMAKQEKKMVNVLAEMA
jgi:hypothetical protein